jgi:hypothetical protein
MTDPSYKLYDYVVSSRILDSILSAERQTANEEGRVTLRTIQGKAAEQPPSASQGIPIVVDVEYVKLSKAPDG